MAKRYYGTSVSMRFILGMIVLLATLMVCVPSQTSSALTTVPTKMNFQGRLTDATGNIKPNGTYNMQLRLYTVNSGGAAVWSESRLVSSGQGVTVTNGLFSIKLGDITTLPATLFASGDLYLEVELPTPATATSASPTWTEGPMTPRNQMATSAYAYNSETLDGLDSADFGQSAGNNTWTGTNTFNVLSESALLVQNGASAQVFKVDTVNQKVTVGVHDSTARVGIEGTGGSVWTARSAAEANDWNGITYGNGLYVAVSTMGTNQVMTSPDGITWTARSTPSNNWISVTYGNGLFVAVSYVSSNQVMTSPDGITWTARTTPDTNGWWSVTYGNGQFVAVAAGGTNRVMTSPDGITWTSRTAAEANEWRSVTYADSQFVAVASSGTNRVMTSPDGITWTARSTGAVDGTWRSVAYGGGLFAAVANGGTNEIMTSPDGITWTARTTPMNGGWNNWYALTYGNGQFLAVANGGEDQVMTSPDGITWTAHTAVQNNSWQAVTYANELFVAVSYDGTNRVMTSKDVALSTRGKVEVVGNVFASGSLSVSGGATIGGVFSVDTTNTTVRVGPATADANAVVLILDSKNTAGDPVGVNGASYYNSNSGKFRCYENGAWKDCDTGGITSGTTAQRPASPTEGAQFFDTTVKQLLVYANGKWQGDRSSSTVIVGANNSKAKDSADFVVSSADEAAGNADTAITSAIAALPAGGGTVYLMEGTYTVDTGIVVPSNVTIAGAGSSSTIIKLKNTHNTDISVLDMSLNAIKSNITIRDLRIDGNKANQTAGIQSGIYAYKLGSGTGAAALTGITIRNVEARDFRNYGIRVHYTENSTIADSAMRGNTVGLYIDSNSYRNIVTNVESTGNTSHGVSLNNADYVSVRDSRMVANGGSGYYMAGSSTNNNTVSGSTMSSNTSYGAYIEYGYDSNFSDNHVVSNGDSGLYLYGGINPSYAGIVISGNTFNSNTGSGVEAYRHVSNATISGNRMSNNTTYGLYMSGYLGTENPKDNTITGNYFYTNASGGIYLSQSDDNVVSSNTLGNNGGATTNNAIRIGGSDSENNSLIGNVVSDTSCTTNCYAIWISGGANTYIADNTVGSNGTILDSGTNTRFGNQTDASGNLITRSSAGIALNTTTTVSSLSLQGGMTNTQLPTPAQPTVARVGTSGSTTYGYRVTALDGTGETLPSTERTITNANATLTGAAYNTISWVIIPGAVQYKVYRTTSGGTPSSTGLIGTVAGGVTTFSDTGIAATTAVPAVNTTGGMSIAGNLVAQGGLDLVPYAPFARFGSNRITLGSIGNTYSGMDFYVRNDAAITSETSGYTYNRFGATNLGGNITTQRLNVFNAPSYSGAYTITNAATVAISGAATTVSGAVISNNYSLWTQGGTVRMDTGNSAVVGQIIRGSSVQSADLLQAQNDAGTVIAKIDASGQIQTPKVNFVTAGGGLSGLSYDTDNNIRFGVLNFGGGQGNVSIGQSADQTRGNGDGNVAIGRYAANGSGSYNVALGNGSGNNSTGGYNTSIGDSSGASITTGANNTFLGARAGNNDNDGTNVWKSLASAQNSTAIGSGAQVQSSNSLVLGSVYNNTKVGIGITAPTNILSVSPLVLHNSWATGFVQASQAGNTVTASSSQFSASNVGEILMWSDGTQTTITGYTSGTVVTVASSETRAASYFRTHKVGFQVASSGFVGIGTLNPGANLDVKTNLNTTTAFRIQDSSGVNLMVADTVNMTVTVRTLAVEYNLTVNGHIISGGSAPTIAAGSASCLAPTLSVSGTDTAGTITVTTGTGCAGVGKLATVTFSTAFANAPRVTLTPATANAVGLGSYVDSATLSATAFDLGIVSATPTDSTTYKWNYLVIQ
jgi:parallel beta-helix repeat protein